MQTVPHLSPFELYLQLCIHKLPKLIALCFLAVRVLNFGVERKTCFVGTLTFTSFCNGLHVIKTSWSAFGCCRIGAVTNSSSSNLVFTKKSHCPVSPGPRDHIFDSAWRLSSQRCTSTAQQNQPMCTPRHSSSLRSNTCDTSCCILATAAKSFNSLDNLRAITPDALLTESSTPKPEAACNSHSATAAKS